VKDTVTTILSICPIRSRPDDTAEMISQLLFGEQAQVIDISKKSWTKIRLTSDAYEGWIDQKMLVEDDTSTSTEAIAMDVITSIFADDRHTWISMGARLPAYDGMSCLIGGRRFRYGGQAIIKDQLAPSAQYIDKVARKLLFAPFLWGGRSALGIDCSGYTQLVFKCCGISISRDAQHQVDQGTVVDFVDSSRLGDLAFFTKESDRISHVGIILEDGKIIHASGRVRIDNLDHYGIFNEDTQRYTHRLRIIKRYF